MHFDSAFINRLLVGNIEYILRRNLETTLIQRTKPATSGI